MRITRWYAHRQRLLVAATQVLALSTWFSASAVAPALTAALHSGSGAAALMTSSVQIGFVVGAVASALLNLPERVPLPLLYGVSGLLAAACTALFPLLVTDLPTAVTLRALTGLFLAGVYPIGLRLTASWAPTAIRGRAFGLLVGALTLGSALPHLIRGFDGLPWKTTMVVAAGIAAIGALAALALLTVGPHATAPAPKRSSALGHPTHGYAWRMFGAREPRLANIGYFGHMWELYALWAWLPAFFTAAAPHVSRTTTSVIAFAAIGIGGVIGCLAGGWAADRIGRARTAASALAVSGACCLLSPIAFVLPTAALALFLLLWGAAVIADSGVFSAALSESVDPRYVGTALTAQTAIGFCLTVASIHLVPVVAELGSWRFAFAILALGPAIGVVAMLRLHRVHQPPDTLARHPSPLRYPPFPQEELVSHHPRPAVGDTAELTRIVGPEDIRLFTEISGDRNPLHYDAELAAASRFGGIVVQGGVTSAILNAVVAERLPGPGTVFLNVNWDFKAPVRPGDEITGRVEVTAVHATKPVTTLKTSVVRADGVTVLEGTAVCYTMTMGRS
ncbi:MFS transporter [Dactylosporangium sp. NPDC051485]|uniref:MFS transporter n=1 Tax=Dactylosporangium sp. NPDC051485 TaxID=3154846 RepID=UPI003447B6F5